MFAKNYNYNRQGFTLVELLIVIAVIGIVAGTILIAINPLAQVQKGRDAKRKSDIKQIAEALRQYKAATGTYPQENNCDTSVGMHNLAAPCPPNPLQSDWDKTSQYGHLYNQLIGGGYLKILPKDPLNNSTYYYSYEPDYPGSPTCPAGGPYCTYWVGAKLENPSSPSKQVFRCSNQIAGEPEACKEVSDWNL